MVLQIRTIDDNLFEYDTNASDELYEGIKILLEKNRIAFAMPDNRIFIVNNIIDIHLSED